MPRVVQGAPIGEGRACYQYSSSFEPSAAAVIIAGIPSATVASAITMASIMSIPLSRSTQRNWRNRFYKQHLPHACFRCISPPKVLVSRLVAKIGPAFRDLWRKSGLAGPDLNRATRCPSGVGDRVAAVGSREPLSSSPAQHRPRACTVPSAAAWENGCHGFWPSLLRKALINAAMRGLIQRRLAF
jgi:hypothetical protein